MFTTLLAVIAALAQVLLPELHADIPAERLEQARAAGAILGDSVWKQFPWVGCSHEPGAGPGASTAHAHAMPTTTDPVEAILARTWRPARMPCRSWMRASSSRPSC